MPTSSNGSVTIERVWKRFREDRPPPAFSDQIKHMANRARQRSGWRWVLRDIDFHIQPGEAVGVVGSNGAGKSTLLKILTQVMYPYAGRVDVRGRVGALIELRGGMHPDLTGRENALLYGSLLGIGRKEVARRFDDIVAFAQLEGSIDRQVKFYSSGMQMRLGFAVAAFLNPDVLLVDEVLAVGDAWFQQRCLDRMREVVNQGTTLVLVSHDLASVEAMCRRGLWLRDGLLVADGPIREVLSDYRSSVEERASEILAGGGKVGLSQVAVQGPDGQLPISHEPIEVSMSLTVSERTRGRLYLGISEGAATPMALVSKAVILEEGTTTLGCRIEDIPLPKGRYYIWLGMEAVDDEVLLPWHGAAPLEVFGPDLDWAPLGVVRLSPVHVKSEWTQAMAPTGDQSDPGRDRAQVGGWP